MTSMKNATEQAILLRPAEAARLIGVSRAKVYDMIARQVLPAVRLDGGRLIRVPRAALDALAYEAMMPPGAADGSSNPTSERLR
jgi:excisionase family DNA binding protein